MLALYDNSGFWGISQQISVGRSKCDNMLRVKMPGHERKRTHLHKGGVDLYYRGLIGWNLNNAQA